MIILVPGSSDKEYTTTDINLIQALMALGHKPVRIEVESSILSYVFDEDGVKQDVRDLSTNTNRTVSIKDVWAANQVWTMNLHRAKNQPK